MKKTLLLAAFAVTALGLNAQVIKSNLLDGYKPGDVLEKGVYEDRKTPIQPNTWMGAFTSKPVEGGVSPKVGKTLSYEGYPEGRLSINMSGYPKEPQQGRRLTAYSLTRSDSEYKGGTYYLACLMNISKLGGRGFVDIFGTDISYNGTGGRGKIFIARDENNMLKFGVGVRKAPENTEGVDGYDFDKTHLVVLKVDYDKQRVSLFVNPKLSDKEPKAAMTVDAQDGELKHGIKGFFYNYRRGYKGYIGNFRFAKTWKDAIGQ